MKHCEECGGSPERGSCICATAYKIRELLKEKFSFSDEELDKSLDDGTIYVTRAGRTPDPDGQHKITFVMKVEE